MEMYDTTKKHRQPARARHRTPHQTAKCELYDPLYNRSHGINCTNEDFPSIIISKCQTRLGNQLSSYAAVLYFQMKYPQMLGIMDSFQMRIIRSVFDMSKMSLKQMDLSKCCRRKKWDQVNALDIEKATQVGLGINTEFEENISAYERNHLVMLGSHSMPIFLYKDILETLKKELQFRPGISRLANKFISSLKVQAKETVFVGIHARRGDRISKWKNKKKWRKSIIGSYEGRFFNHVMDMFRKEYNSDTSRVVFIPTSDDFPWLVKHLINKDDIFYPKQKIAATRVALPSNKEIGQIFSHRDLAVKGAMSYGVDLAVLSMCNHTVLDYGTFGLWAAVLAGGRIVLPTGYSSVATPDTVWWETAGLSNVEYVDVNALNITADIA